MEKSYITNKRGHIKMLLTMKEQYMSRNLKTQVFLQKLQAKFQTSMFIKRLGINQHQFISIIRIALFSKITNY